MCIFELNEIVQYIDPAESSAVLPIVHVKGFKISEQTIYGFRSQADGTKFWAALRPLATCVCDVNTC
jgi:phosphoketolase